MNFRRGRTVVIVRSAPTGTDRYGDRRTDTEQRIPVKGCAWAPRTQGAGPSSAEIRDRGRAGRTEGLTLFMPSGTDIRHTDQVELPGKGLFDVEGDEGDWWSPYSGREYGLEVSIRQSEG